MTIVDNYFPFDTGPGSTATAARWRLMARLYRGSGVIYGFLNNCAATIAGSVVTVQMGAVWVDGYYGEIDTPKAVTVSGNGMVVIRMDPTARQVLVMFVANQTIPTRNLSGIYEVPIMQVTGATGKDIRQFAQANASPKISGGVYRSGAWNTSTTPYVFGFDAYLFGSQYFPTGPGTFTCPVDGDYLVSCQGTFISSATNQWYNVWTLHNGAQNAWQNNSSSAPSQYTPAQITDIIPCAAGDTIQMLHQCGNNGLTGLAGNPIFNWLKVRALV
jgi:hypothetical protein